VKAALALADPGSEAEARAELAALRGVAEDQILFGDGSLGVLRTAARSALAEGGSALMPQHSFALAGEVLSAAGGRLIEGPAIVSDADPGALLRAVQPDTRLVFLAQVSNPTSERVGREYLHALAAGLREDILLVVDEAYAEYDAPQDDPATATCLTERERLLVLRTFSTFHGLADPRVGYGLGNPYVLSRFGPGRRLPRPAAVLAALRDRAFADGSRALNAEARAAFLEEAARHRCSAGSSGGNFACLESMLPAAELAKDLAKKGVLVKPLETEGLPNHVRIALGTPEAMERFWRTATPILDGTGCYL
jgi:histidinol-phosphate aminotransferase